MKFDDIFAVDRKREEGAWVKDFSRDLPGLVLKVRGDGCAEHERRAAEVWSKATPEQRRDPDYNLKVEKQLLLDVILVDWKIGDRPYSREDAERALDTATFRIAVTRASQLVGAQGAEALEDDAKN